MIRKPPAATEVARKVPTHDEAKDHLLDYSDTKTAYWTESNNQPRPIRYAKSGLASQQSTPASTVMKTFKAAADKHGDKPALRTEDFGQGPPAYDNKTKSCPPSVPFNEWKTWTYQEYYNDCRLAAKGFTALGLKRYDAVTIYGFNCPEWLMAQNGGMMAGGIAAGIYPSDTPAQVIFKASHSNASIAACQSKKAKTFEDGVLEGKLPNLKAIIVWDEEIKESKIEGPNGQSVVKLSWQAMKDKGASVDDATIDAISDSVSPGDVACYIYTSGTTGNPKAVMITHDNILFESGCALHLLPEAVKNGEQRCVSYLPLSHVAGCMVDIVMPLVLTAQCDGWAIAGFARVYDLSKSTIGDRLRCVEPTLFLGVPRVWEKIAEKIQRAGAAASPTLKKISAYCKGKGVEHANHCQLGGSGDFPAWYKLAEKLVFKKVKGLLGLNQCKFAFTGAAPISTETLSYYGSLGLQVNEVYGMSECTGATTWSTDEAHVWGSCGFAMPGTEVKVFNTEGKTLVECEKADDIFKPTEAQQGEICFRGRHIMAGYLANPAFGEAHVAEIKKKNSDAIDADGWLHSGDKGVMGKNGMLKITGRYKELIIGSGGENIAPVPIENNVKALCPAISNIMMVGDKKKYNTALVTLKCVGASGYLAGTSDLEQDAALHGCTTVAEAAANQAYIDMIKKAITDTNENAGVVPSRACKIQKFTILPLDFSTETNELTPTLKLKRGYTASMDKYQDIISRLYAPGAGDYVPFVGTTVISTENLKVDIPEDAPSQSPKSPLMGKDSSEAATLDV